MNIHVLAIYDRVAKMYMQPMFVQNIASAIRGFIDEVNREDQQSNLYKHSEDFDLYKIAEWDDETGQFTDQWKHDGENGNQGRPVNLIKGAACKRS